MEEKKRINAIGRRSAPTEAEEVATKIQASFRGYQVRKQLNKLKNGSSDILATRRAPRRKNSGRNTNQDNQSKNELQEKSATKIQAGIRGFLVRKRQKNAKKRGTDAA